MLSESESECGSPSLFPNNAQVVDSTLQSSEVINKIMNLASKKPIFDGTFFQVIPEKSNLSGSIVAECKRCTTKIKGSFASTSNYLSHLKRKHGQDELDNFIKHKNMKLSNRSLSNTSTQSVSQSNNGRSKKNTKFSQEMFEEDVMAYILHTQAPLNTVENEYFRAMFNNINIQNLKHMSRRSLCRKIMIKFETYKEMIKIKLSKANIVCTTADVWSNNHKRFMGMTVHWIDAKTFERKSAALACRRFEGTHSYDRIASLLESINNEYGLNVNKIAATITDNGSNFVKAFKEYGLQHSDFVDNDDLDFDLITDNVYLPKHKRCCSHTLSLIATTNIIKGIENSSINELHNAIMRKCCKIWSACSLPKTAEIIKSSTGLYFSRPCITRWNSMFDALSKISSNKNKIMTLFEKIDLDLITEIEFSYLEENIKCIAPLADALDKLQGEKNMYYGYVIPCLLNLKIKMQKIQSENLRFCSPIVLAILKGIEKRFKEILNFDGPENDAVIATLTLPQFKNRWVKATGLDSQLFRNKLTRAVTAELGNKSQSINVNAISEDECDDFDFGSESENEDSSIFSENIYQQAELEVLRYFGDKRRDLTMLNEFPNVKTVFMKFNCMLPSSAPVERLFSFATMVDMPRSRNLTDQMFEMRILARANDIMKL